MKDYDTRYDPPPPTLCVVGGTDYQSVENQLKPKGPMKQTVEHTTPGPWHVGINPGPIVYGPNGEQVADCLFDNGDDNKANARLISVSPELFDFVEAYARGELVDRTAAAHLISKAKGQPCQK